MRFGVTSSVANCLASSTAGRSGDMRILVDSRMRFVTLESAASNALMQVGLLLGFVALPDKGQHAVAHPVRHGARLRAHLREEPADEGEDQHDAEVHEERAHRGSPVTRGSGPSMA